MKIGLSIRFHREKNWKQKPLPAETEGARTRAKLWNARMDF